MDTVIVFVGEDIVAQTILCRLEVFGESCGLRVKPFIVVEKTRMGKAKQIDDYLRYEKGKLSLAPTKTTPVELCRDVNSPYLFSMIKRESVLCAMNIRGKQKFKENIISHFRSNSIPFVNLHPGVLPDYRGLFSTFWAMKNDEITHGCTLHEIDHDFDTGPIISIAKTNIDYRKCVLSNLLNLIPLGESLIKEYLSQLRTGKKPRLLSQEKNRGKYYSIPDKGNIIQFMNDGKYLVNTEIFLEMLKNLNYIYT